MRCTVETSRSLERDKIHKGILIDSLVIYLVL